MRFLLLSTILFTASLCAQTAAVPALPVPIPALTVPLPAVVQPAQNISITVPKNGGKVSFTIPQQTLLKDSQALTTPATASTTSTSAPVNLSGTSLTFTMQLTAAQAAALQSALANGGNVTGITITMTQVKP